MSLSTIAPTPDRWTSVRHPWRPGTDAAPRPADAFRALVANARIGSLARIFAGGDEWFLGADLPPLPGPPELATRLMDDAEREIKTLGKQNGDSKTPDTPPQLLDADTETTETMLASIRETDWTAEPKSGGTLTAPIGHRRRAAGKLGLIDKHPAIYIESLDILPTDSACRDAALFHSLVLAASLRLARPALAVRGDSPRLVWAVPLADPGPAFLAHALGALAAVVAQGLPESQALATDPNLASRWLALHAPRAKN